MTSEHAVYASAALAFLATAAIGFAFKPLLGE
jgi:hypothetical protein